MAISISPGAETARASARLQRPLLASSSLPLGPGHRESARLTTAVLCARSSHLALGGTPRHLYHVAAFSPWRWACCCSDGALVARNTNRATSVRNHSAPRRSRGGAAQLRCDPRRSEWVDCLLVASTSCHHVTPPWRRWSGTLDCTDHSPGCPTGDLIAWSFPPAGHQSSCSFMR